MKDQLVEPWSCPQCAHDNAANDANCIVCHSEKDDSNHTTAASSSLTPLRREKLEELFHEIDVDGSGHMEEDEVFDFADIFGLNPRDAKKACSAMMSDIDRNQDGKVQIDEWCIYLAEMSKDLDDGEFLVFFENMLETVKRSKLPIKWSPGVRNVFYTLLVIQIVVFSVLAVLTSQQYGIWNTFSAKVGSVGNTSDLRMATSIVGAVVSFLGLCVGKVPEARRGKALTYFGVLNVCFFFMCLASGVLDGYIVASGESVCAQACKSDCNVLPTAEYRSCSTLPCSCGFTIAVGPAAAVEGVILTSSDAGGPGGTFNLTVAGYSTSNVSPSVSASALASALNSLVVQSANASANTSAVTFQQLYGPSLVNKKSVAGGSCWTINFTQAFLPVSVLVNAAGLTGTNAAASTSVVVAGRSTSLIVPKANVFAANAAAADTTVALLFVSMALSGICAIIAVYFSTSCGRGRYLSQWSQQVLSFAGLSPATRLMMKRWWFKKSGASTRRLQIDEDRV